MAVYRVHMRMRRYASSVSSGDEGSEQPQLEAVMDPGCQRTVAGRLRLRKFVNALKRRGVRIQRRPDSNRFRFGDGRSQRSLGKLIIPVEFD